MPTYLYKCVHCLYEMDLFRTISKRNDPAVCMQCGGHAERSIEVPMAPHMGIPGQGQGIKYSDGSGMSTKVRKNNEISA